MNKKHLCLLPAAAAALMLASCNPSQPVSTGTIRPEGNCIGKVADESGKPVAGASVLLVPEGYSPLEPENNAVSPVSTTSDESGYFGFTVESSGKYNLLAAGNDLYALRKAVPVNASQSMELPEEVLRDPGSLSGSVRLQSMEDHRSAVILLIGTNTYAAPDNADGAFSLPELAGGVYDLRVMSTESGFSVVDTEVTVVSGEATALPEIVLEQKRVPQIDEFTVAYDPVMMVATLFWSTSDIDIIDSFYIYCNREQNIVPIRSTGGNVNTITIDMVAEPLETRVYQIAAVGNDGWEGPAQTGAPFDNGSIITVSDMTLPEVVDTGDPVSDIFYHFTKYGIYRVTETRERDSGCTITKFSTGYTEENEIHHPKSLSYVDANIRSDADGNLYMLLQAYRDTSGTVSLVKFDRDLNIVDQYDFIRSIGAHTYSFGVSSDGNVILYSANRSPTRDQWPDDSTVVTVFDQEFSVLSGTVYPDSRMILESFFSDDSITAVVASNAWESERIFFYDASFSVIGSMDPFRDLDIPFPSDYDPEDFYILICCPGLFMTGNDIFGEDDVMYFFNSDIDIVARHPYPGSRNIPLDRHSDGKGFYSDNSGFLYEIHRDDKRYSLEELIDALNK